MTNKSLLTIFEYRIISCLFYAAFFMLLLNFGCKTIENYNQSVKYMQFDKMDLADNPKTADGLIRFGISTIDASPNFIDNINLVKLLLLSIPIFALRKLKLERFILVIFLTLLFFLVTSAGLTVLTKIILQMKIY